MSMQNTFRPLWCQAPPRGGCFVSVVDGITTSTRTRRGAVSRDEVTHRAAHQKVQRYLLVHAAFGRELVDLAVKVVYEKLPLSEFKNLCRERGITKERLREIGTESAARHEAHLERNPRERWQRPRTKEGQLLLLRSWGASPRQAMKTWQGRDTEVA